MQKSLLASLALFSLLFTACQVPGTETEEQVNEPIKIGFIGPLSGDAAALGPDLLHGAQMKLQEVNDAGGINGRQVTLIAEDGRCTGSDAAAAAQKLIHIDQVAAIHGGACSSETLAAAPIAEAAGVILLSPVSSSPDVTAAGDFIFRNYPSDDSKGMAFSMVFEQRELKKIALISENTDFCQGIRRSVAKYLPQDAAIVFDEVVDPGTKDYRTLLTRMQNTEFDAFVVNVQSDTTGAALLAQFRELGFEQIAFGTDTTDSMTMFENAAEALENFFVVSVPEFDTQAQFAQKFIAAFGEPQWGMGFAAHAYDAMGVLLRAMSEAGVEGAAVRDALYNVPSYEGETGTFHFDENGDVVGIPFALKEFKNGAITTVENIVLDDTSASSSSSELSSSVSSSSSSDDESDEEEENDAAADGGEESSSASAESE